MRTVRPGRWSPTPRAGPGRAGCPPRPRPRAGRRWRHRRGGRVEASHSRHRRRTSQGYSLAVDEPPQRLEGAPLELLHRSLALVERLGHLVDAEITDDAQEHDVALVGGEAGAQRNDAGRPDGPEHLLLGAPA